MQQPIVNAFRSDLDLEELTNEVDGLETLAKEMEVFLLQVSPTITGVVSDLSPSQQRGKNKGEIDKDPRRET